MALPLDVDTVNQYFEESSHPYRVSWIGHPLTPYEYGKTAFCPARVLGQTREQTDRIKTLISEKGFSELPAEANNLLTCSNGQFIPRYV